MATSKDYFARDFAPFIGYETELSSAPNPHGVVLKIQARAYFDPVAQSKFAAVQFDDCHNIAIETLIDGLRKHTDKLLALREGNTVLAPSSPHIYPGFRLQLENLGNGQHGIAIFPDAETALPVTSFVPTGVLYIYTDSPRLDSLVSELQSAGRKHGLFIRLRGKTYGKSRDDLDRPMAFICHDSRDKDVYARPLVKALGGLQVTVWYDEYSMKPGDKLRDSIEKGIKECGKCVLLLTSNFLRNSGWTKTEFDSIFTRQLIERNNLIVPVWAGVGKEEVFQYSPSLANVVGAPWAAGDHPDVVAKKLLRTLRPE